MSQDYEDEYDEWEDDEPEPEYTYGEYVARSYKGRLYIQCVTGIKYPYEDWGMADFQCENLSLNRLNEKARAYIVDEYRYLKNGQSDPFRGYPDEWDDEIDEGEINELA